MLWFNCLLGLLWPAGSVFDILNCYDGLTWLKTAAAVGVATSDDDDLFVTIGGGYFNPVRLLAVSVGCFVNGIFGRMFFEELLDDTQGNFFAGRVFVD